jgi:hypothetical protein
VGWGWPRHIVRMVEHDDVIHFTRGAVHSSVAVYKATTLWPQTHVFAGPGGCECRVGVHLIYLKFTNFTNDEAVNVEGVLYF